MTGPLRTATARQRHRASLRPDWLEGRFLLSLDLASNPGSGLPAETVPAPDSVIRVDQFDLPSTADWPQASVELRWTAGTDSLTGRLVVLDAWGRNLADAPVLLTGTDVVAAVPGRLDAGGPLASLAVSLRLTPGDGSNTDPGVYQLDVQYRPGYLPQGQTIYGPCMGESSSTATENPPLSSTPIPPDPPSLRLSRSLPLFTPAASPPSGGGAGLPTPTEPTNHPAVPIARSKGVAFGLVPTVVKLSVGSIGGAPGSAFAVAPAVGGGPAVVGPLPLGMATESGGILACSRTVPGSPSLIETVDRWTTPPGRTRSVRPSTTAREPVVVLAPRVIPDAGHDLTPPEVLAATGVAATGVAVLAPILNASTLVEPPAIASETDLDPDARPPRARLSAVVGGAAVGSALMMVRLTRTGQGLGTSRDRAAASSWSRVSGGWRRSRINRPAR